MTSRVLYQAKITIYNNKIRQKFCLISVEIQQISQVIAYSITHALGSLALNQLQIVINFDEEGRSFFVVRES
jgi:hypothetical protein